ncbi:nucleotidyltransferase family protein [Streptomyces griseoluteus]|uniref:Nucleotidyltransferase family protein n=1 Tax=Streptomyces griseoluteus TaxID=29306 RepID=A0A4Z1DHD8_STRGP|nr:nucleotidyltransferase family protein [Streptomyces griseoluteus]TGN82511.1 nucleotidyltransferase family protein [Streptomyces griseoluteus]GHF08888.1 4-diphosphocytidyl-2C-methyl-D-erythritol synthase [Streptomyces griseoluteus]
MTPDQAPSHPRVAGLLLAAGGGRRLGGRPKALLRHDGALLVERAARALWDAGCARVHVVLGAGAEEVRGRAELSGCVLVDNPGWGEGMGSSLRAGLRSLGGTDARGALVGLVDQPGIGPEAYARVLDAFSGEASLVSAAYDGRRGHPVLLGVAHWAGVAGAARGDRGAREYLRAHSAEIRLVECGDVADAYDVDTGADLGRLRPGGAH